MLRCNRLIKIMDYQNNDSFDFKATHRLFILGWR